MPRIALPAATEIVDTGIAPPAETNGDATNQHDFTNDGKMFLLVRNASASVARTVTIITPGTVAALAIADRAISVPLSSSRYIGPFPPNIWNADGKVQVDVEHADLKLSLFRLPT